MASSEEARKAFQEYMSNATTNRAGNQAAQQAPGQVQGQMQPPANFMPPMNMNMNMNPYAGGLQPGAYGYPNPLPGLNPYAGQPGVGYNPQAQGMAAPTAALNGQAPPQATPTTALATAQQIAATQGRSNMPPPPLQPPGYVNPSRSYGPPQQSQPVGPYNGGYQYGNPPAPTQNTTGASTLYTGAWPPPDVPPYPEPPRNDMPVIVPAHMSTASDPVYVLSHVCSVCGRMRSAAYHRHHPIVPGQPSVPTPCRKCKKKAKEKHDKRPGKDENTITIKIDDGSRRGRARSRSEVRYVRSYSSPSPRRTVVRAGSRANIGLRVLQDERNVPPSSRRKSRISSRYYSPSPPPETRGRYRPPGSFPSPESPDYEPRVRYIEASPSPPPLRTRTRLEYREESLERPSVDYRARSLSPIRVPRRGYRNNDDAETRITSHPAPFRTVGPDHRPHLHESEASHSTSSPTGRLSPRRGILRNASMEYETTQRRRMQESLNRQRGSDVEQDYHTRRCRYSDERPLNSEEFRYSRRTEREYVDAPRSPSPPTRSFERLRVRHSSPPSSRDYEMDTHVRYISPDNHHRVELRARHSSPPPPPPRPEYRPSTRARGDERAPLALPDPRHEDWEDVTDTGSEDSRDMVQYVRYKEYDANGRAYDVVEERRTRKVSGPSSQAGGPPDAALRAFPDAPALTRSYGAM
ncbi:hypothetical protein DM02DRAFT_672629 [Periconia macrospinosa]|uniref:Uncharacterized protein n=1 Tax=Periconia macrospinosa TaxID=97972 RepID=A0A2V1DN95_9PLEO|nr:hypothetical protein DM02DRAFT_672629 [Periconia macrospinosa]